MTTLTRYCSTCGILKPLDEFHRDAKRPHGRRESCKDCTVKRARESRASETADDKATEAERGRRRRAQARSLNWERVQQLLVEAVMWPPGPQAQDIGKQVEEMLAGAASKPLPRGGAPAAWDAIVDIRALIRATEDAQIAVECALLCERLDVVDHVLLPQAESAVAWADRQHSPKRVWQEAKRLLNSYHAEKRVLEKKIAAVKQRSAYTRAMKHLARKLRAMGVR